MDARQEDERNTINISVSSDDLPQQNQETELQLDTLSDQHEEEPMLPTTKMLMQQETKEKNISFGKFMKQLLCFFGPATMVSIGYVDPGNWATDIAGGSLFEYKMLWVLLLSNVIAIVLQSLAAKLGLATGKDLSQQCTNYYPRWISVQLWILAELAIAATDLAEVLGTAIGLNLLFGLPLLWGVILTAADTLLFLVFQQLGHRFMEFVIFLLMAIISVCFIIEMFYSKPSIIGIIDGFIPRLPPGSLPIATGILGATIMPHNIYLHSGLVLTRKSHSFTRTKRYINFAIIDSVLSLNVALFVNAAIIIVSAAAFYDKSTKPEIIQDAYKMLRKIFGAPAAIIFAVGLLAAGQASTICGTLAGQMVMEGFVNWKMWPWLRRFLTRSIAIVPAVIVILITGDDGSYLLVWSQVILSIQLPFAMIPLIRITSHKDMGAFKNNIILTIVGWIFVLIVIALNIWLLVDVIMESFVGKPWWAWAILICGAVLYLLFFAIVMFWPIRAKENTTVQEHIDEQQIEAEEAPIIARNAERSDDTIQTIQ